MCVCIIGGPEGVECARIHESERGGLVTSDIDTAPALPAASGGLHELGAQ